MSVTTGYIAYHFNPHAASAIYPTTQHQDAVAQKKQVNLYVEIILNFLPKCFEIKKKLVN